MSVNKVFIVGNLGQDPEVHTSQSGFMSVTLSVATSTSWKDKNTGEKREEVEWHRIVLMGHSAEFAKNYLKKSMKVYVEGRIRTRKWTDSKGIERYTTEVVGSNVLSLERAGNNRPPEPPAIDDGDVQY
ncbi:single-stranded DNA-binding protein [Pelistega sp. MC2]|uniref:single-stranded DNA-binding protein n=1 Tax=Pelistega sp. MC2 TaxID=1720297 RepID=UPI0008DAFE5E|nr:single-stranded DNA-binding protein [Pelistega sp. MC2]